MSNMGKANWWRRYGDKVYYAPHLAEWAAKLREEREDAIQRVRYFPSSHFPSSRN
jgi:hypothetical protein